ncbi:MAG: hypothetical protein PHG87_06990 [Candidatus Omnitrophica bacterium]|nr:hypothetical protein [Candidatus Omnitrophota bacterium]
MQAILTILGIAGLLSLIGWLIKIDNTHKDNELYLYKEIKYLRVENAKLQDNIKNIPAKCMV